MFDMRSVEAPKKGSYEPIPEGDYPLLITDAEVKDTKAGTGQYLNVTMEITAGDFKGRKLWHLFNIANPNPEAVRIAKEQMKAMMLASGLPEDKCVVKDVGDFCGMSFMARVKVDGDKNKIHYFIQNLAPEQQAKVKQEAKKANPFAGW